MNCLKLKFEMAAIRQADHLWKEKDPASYTLRLVDVRDLVRVSSSIADATFGICFNLDELGKAGCKAF